MKNYTVQTRGLDGAETQGFKLLDKAIKRFTEASGTSLESAIAAAFEGNETMPTIRSVLHVRATSSTGTVVDFFRNRDAEPEPTDAAPAPTDE